MISYDFTNMLRASIGGAGISEQDIEATSAQVAKVHEWVLAEHERTAFGFANLSEDEHLVSDIQNAVEKVASFKNLVVIGVGGSDLGARALIRAFRNEQLQKKMDGMNVYFLGATTDPEEISEVLSQISLKETAINIISKSGGTLEPMSTFLYLRELLIAEVGFANHGKHIVATTDAESGALKDLMDIEEHIQLTIPANVGGRFSVLSAVGLFPAACAGIHIEELLSGADQVTKETLAASNPQKNNAMMFGLLHYLGLTVNNQNIAVMLPYSVALEKVGHWFRQLWAESLGKAEDYQKREVHVGQTPVAALGPTDQHSQLQLWNDGPFDKLITFIRVDSFRDELQLPGDLSFVPSLQYLENKHFGEMMRIEQEATAQSLAEAGRPNGIITLPQLSEEHIGALLMFFQWAVVYMGALLNVNTFDQPGVERSKQIIKQKLGG